MTAREPPLVAEEPRLLIVPRVVVVTVFALDDERGRVDEEAILGNVDPPLRPVVLGVPEARFLKKHIYINRAAYDKRRSPLLDNISLERKWSNNAVEFLDGRLSDYRRHRSIKYARRTSRRHYLNV